MKNNIWTSFYDVETGGKPKLLYKEIYINTDITQAKILFKQIFDIYPDQVSCDCPYCDEDFWIEEINKPLDLITHKDSIYITKQLINQLTQYI